MEGNPALAPPGPLLDARAQNRGKADWEITEVYSYGAGLRSLLSIVGLSQFCNLRFLSLHGNQLERIEGLDALKGLEELNLSSNNISKMEGLSELTALKVLNLSSNRLTEIGGLQALVALTKLVLSHNRIVLLGGLSALHGPRYSIQHLDLRDNLVCALSELWVLAGCMNLRELILAIGKHQNPVCQTMDYQRSVIAALPHLQSLDGQLLPSRPIAEPFQTVSASISGIPHYRPGVYYQQLPPQAVQSDPSGHFPHQPPLEPVTQLHVPSSAPNPPQGMAMAPQMQAHLTANGHVPLNLVRLPENSMGQPIQGQKQQAFPTQPPTQRSGPWTPANVVVEQPEQLLKGHQPHVSWPDQAFSQQQSQPVYLAPALHAEAQISQPSACWQALQAQRMAPTGRGIGACEDSGWVPIPYVDRALNGFHRRKQHRRPFAYESREDDETSAARTEKGEERIGLLESRVLDLVEQLAKAKIQGSRYSPPKGGHHVSVGTDSKTERGQPKNWKHSSGARRSREEIAVCTGNDSAKGKRCFEVAGRSCLPRKRSLDSVVDKTGKILTSDDEWGGATMDSGTQTILQTGPSLDRMCQEIHQLQSQLASLAAQPSTKVGGQGGPAELMDMLNDARVTHHRARQNHSEGHVNTIELDRERRHQADTAKNAVIAELQLRLEGKCAEIDRLKDSLARMEAIVADKHQTTATTENTELLAARSELLSLKQDLVVANRLHENAERTLKDLAAEVASLKVSAAAQEKALDEERALLKVAERDLEVCRLKEAAARKEIKHLLNRTDGFRIEQQKQLEHVKVSCQEQAREQLSRELAAAELKSKTAADKAINSLRDHLQAKLYNVENELRQALQDKASISQQMSSIQESASKEALELKQALKTILTKERRAEALVGELTGVVQSQKLKLQSVHQELKELPIAQEELRELRNEVSALRLKASKSEDLARELEGLKCKVAEASLLAQTETDNVVKEQRLQLESLKEEKNRLASEAASCLEKFQVAEDAIRIKSKMLDSQNETIKELKLELKEARREIKTVADTVDAKWHERMRDDLEQGIVLRKDLAVQERTIYELERQLKLEKSTVKTLEHANSSVQRKLAEKDSMLRYVEEEIARVKSMFESREKALAAERDSLLEQLKQAAKEKDDAVAKVVAETQLQQKELFDLNRTLEAREQQIASVVTAKDKEISEFSRKLMQMEKELHQHLQAKQKSKLLSSHKVNQLCKVLEELREVT